MEKHTHIGLLLKGQVVYKFNFMSILEKEIKRIISKNSVDLFLLKNEEKEKIINDIKSTFVYNNPRVFWLDFKYIAKSIKYNSDYPYLKIPDLIDNDEILYFLIDDFNKNFHLLKGQFRHIFFFIEECEGLDEYYIISQNIDRIICENDHDELLYIDINKNPKKENASN